MALEPQTCAPIPDPGDSGQDFCAVILPDKTRVQNCIDFESSPEDFFGCNKFYEETPPLDLDDGNRFAVIVSMAIAAALVGLLVVGLFSYQVLQYEQGTPKMIKIAHAIHTGAKAFLHREYTYLTGFVVIIFAVLCGILWESDNLDRCGVDEVEDCNRYQGNPGLSTQGVFTGLSFLLGAFLSGSAGYFGMFIATKANVRTTWACNESMNEGLKVAFKSGATMGLTVVSFGLLGLSILYLIFTVDTEDQGLIWQYISGFGFGASSIALFARVGGGIYTKAADVGADLVGKVEAGIPEDDPNNPATIADNVGDNVGDVAGMGADLFESYCGSIIAACTIGYDTYGLVTKNPGESCCVYGVLYDSRVRETNYALSSIALPFWISGFGVISSIIGMLFVRTDASEQEDSGAVLEKLLGSIRNGIIVSSVLVLGLNAVACYITFGGSDDEWRLYGCTIIGLVAGNVIGQFTEYCTSYSFQPTQSISKKAITGPATVIIQGLGVGMLSTGIPLLSLVITVIATNALAGRYGIALSAVSMLATLGITLATDAYGPVADNAGGIAEMAGDDVKETTRERTDALDAMGNTTAATGKGFAIGSAALTSVALISAFIDAVGLQTVNLEDPIVIAGMLIGATLPFIFAALTMLSVGRAAEAIIFEVRKQFEAHPELKDPGYEGPEGVPDYTQCVAISTNASIMEMTVPGGIAIFMPPAIGYLLGSRALVGMLVGSLVAGILLAITMANSGGAWDNAKKFVEKKGLGEHRAKGTEFHAAVVVGDTVGDPFKDTSGPALNILIKMMSLISLVLAPSFRSINITGEAFEEDSWWIGFIILIVVGLVLIIAQFKIAGSYGSIEDEVDKAAIELEEQRHPPPADDGNAQATGAEKAAEGETEENNPEVIADVPAKQDE